MKLHINDIGGEIAKEDERYVVKDRNKISANKKKNSLIKKMKSLFDFDG